MMHHDLILDMISGPRGVESEAEAFVSVLLMEKRTQLFREQPVHL